jgi:hypothetical protein
MSDRFPGVAEVLINFERPASMSTSDMRAWIGERARAAPAITLDGADGRESGALVLRVEVREGWTRAVEDQLADLMMDMRLLGLRPTVVSPRG